MKVRAIAAKDPRSNTVGTVEIEAHAEGLVLIHVGASTFNEGYVPGTPTQQTGLFVPWSAVRTASIEDDQLFLAIDPALSPLNRMVLRGFSSHVGLDHRELYRRRLIIRLTVAAALIVTVLLAFVVAPRASQDRPLVLALSVSTIAASLLLSVGFAADKWLVGGSAAALRDRAAFFSELSLYLPRAGHRPDRPAIIRDPSSWPLIGMAERLVPRSTTAVVIALSASTLAALLTGKWLFTQHTASQPAANGPNVTVETTRSGSAGDEASPFALPSLTENRPQQPAMDQPATAQPAAPAAAAPVATPALTGPCRCDRAESILWRNAIPRLSPVLIAQNVRPHNNHTHLELELGIVNNSNQELREITLNLQFYEDKRNARNKGDEKERDEKKHQPLYFEGPLRPGEAVKWHVEGRATSFEVSTPHHEMLDASGKDAAPATAFEELLSTANHRPIRLHGAMMLAALGHEQRAREGALSLREALREDEAPYIDRLLSATGPIATCQLSVSDGSALRKVQTCVHNRSTTPAPGVTLRVRA
ncbi:MAG TPA: hypothetical protein VHO25_18030, partial [Polyangiaceae bacterium]|nr:hypothetical protein [Polyangiaceae bacterium]